METPDRKQRLSDCEQELEMLNHEITAAVWGDDYCYTNGKMGRLQQEKNKLVYTISALKAGGE